MPSSPLVYGLVAMAQKGQLENRQEQTTKTKYATELTTHNDLGGLSGHHLHNKAFVDISSRSSSCIQQPEELGHSFLLKAQSENLGTLKRKRRRTA